MPKVKGQVTKEIRIYCSLNVSRTTDISLRVERFAGALKLKGKQYEIENI
jgi:hypothetical protein